MSGRWMCYCLMSINSNVWYIAFSSNYVLVCTVYVKIPTYRLHACVCDPIGLQDQLVGTFFHMSVIEGIVLIDS